MFVEKENYLVLKEFQNLGIEAIYTKKNYGNVLELTKERFLNDFGGVEKNIVAGHQTHSDNIEIIESLDKLYFEDTDGFITNRKDIVIYTKYADCLPIYIVDSVKEIVALVHSGWQGSFKGIGKKAIEMMIKRYNCNLKDIKVAFGIGISSKNYEVGEEFLKKFQEKYPKDMIDCSFKNENGKLLYDNQRFVYLDLVRFGIDENNIILNDLCTYEGEFHSYRRDRERSGRNGAFIFFR
ncbi:peptidoglycan editing factor PgeF [Fusobacterium sp.]|uniref:peptidoglycan editing factor PgeF n=1 Tax=Fusobacterium sp. TaxID=68766 RepID=UPI0025B86313|nr:peptidoglycan editing factor PgeF [Fusobacterium sp.]